MTRCAFPHCVRPLYARGYCEPDRPWTPFEEREPQGPVRVFVNSRYQVLMRAIGHGHPMRFDARSGEEGPPAEGVRGFWLSIKTHDKAPVHDWRDFQRIKNELVGPEAEGVELYPAESRLVDTSNQYHLWVFEGFKFPFGYVDRLVVGESTDTTRQRPFNDGEKPADAKAAHEVPPFSTSEEDLIMVKVPAEVAVSVMTGRLEFLKMLVNRVERGEVIPKDQILGLIQLAEEYIGAHARDRARLCGLRTAPGCEGERMDWKPEPYLAMEKALTPEEKRAFLDRFTGLNPCWRGAEVADVLSALDSEDSHLDVTEPLGQAMRDEMGEAHQLFRLACYAVIWIHGQENTSAARVRDLMMRASAREGP